MNESMGACMVIKTLWGVRCQAFYRKMFRYYSIIGANVVYFFVIIGSIFIYYFHLFLQWIPPQISIELILSLFSTLILMQTKIRTFIKRADIIFLLPLEWKLKPYVIKSLVYSFSIQFVKVLSLITVLFSLLLHESNITFSRFILIAGIVCCSVLMKWTEQWLENYVQLALHRLIKLLSIYLMFYFLFNHDLVFEFVLMGLNFVYIIFQIGRKRNLNWQWLIVEEENALLGNYKFINIFMDVPNFKHSFRKRRLLTMFLNRCIPYRQSSSLIYLYLHLFVRYNDYFYLYLQLTVIGIFVNYAMPASGWMFNLLILVMTGLQVIPLQHQIKQTVMLYPISNSRMNDSFLKSVLVILYAQFFILSFALFILTSTANIYFLITGILFVYVFVYYFVSKKVNVLERD